MRKFILDDMPEDAGFGCLQPLFQPHLPLWQKVYALPEAEFLSGLYIFKASLDGRWRGTQSVWRRLTVPGKATLDLLAMAVLDAFEFDDTEHLYEFRYRDQTGAPRVYNHYYCEEGPYAHQIKMGEIGLPEKGTLRFHFDFGDDWRFVLRLERIARADKRIRRPTVIESCGEPPKQYRNAEG